MSTVLKAVQELDRRGGSLTATEVPGADGYRSTTWAIAVLALGLVVAVGVIGRRGFHGARAPHDPVMVPAPVALAPAPAVAVVAPPLAPVAVAAAPAAAVALPPPAPLALAAAPAVAVAAPPPAPIAVASEVAVRSTAETVVSDVAARSRSDAAAPWGRIETPPAEASVNVEARPRPRHRPPAAPEYVRSAAVSPPATVIEAPEIAAPQIDAPAPAAPAHDAATGRGVPRVQVRAIVSGADPNGRRVVLRIGGGPSVTLHEGESSDGVDVQFITANTVYLRHHGNIFTVGIDR